MINRQPPGVSQLDRVSFAKWEHPPRFAKPYPTSISFHESKPSWVPEALEVGEAFHEKGSGRFCQRLSLLRESYVVFEINSEVRQ